jgi:hypothetical protein
MALVVGNSHIFNPKLCINCKNFIRNHNIGNKYGKCKAFPIIFQKDDEYLITGIIRKDKTYYNYCNVARANKNMCRENGIKFEGKND